MSTFITVLYVFCCVAAIVLVLAVAAFITWYCVVDRPDSRAGHASGAHSWFAPELLAPARHALCAAMNVPGPEAAFPPAADVPGPGTLHRTEIHHNAAIAWEHAGNRRAGNWPMSDPGDFTPSAWTKRSAAELATRLAREETDAGFASINPAGIVAYACSSVLPRWKEVA
jgi:hypothetical protein